jgi:ubiquinone/menaquinone biosynthesis C-methylase UbiE
VDAVDSSSAMLEVLDAKVDRKGLTTVRTMSDIPLLPATYDLVACSSVCGFLDDYPGTVAELVSLLRPGGLFVQWDWEAEPTAVDPHGLTRAAITEALDAAGLTSVTVGVGFRVEVGGETMAPLMGAGRRGSLSG